MFTDGDYIRKNREVGTYNAGKTIRVVFILVFGKLFTIAYRLVAALKILEKAFKDAKWLLELFGDNSREVFVMK